MRVYSSKILHLIIILVNYKFWLSLDKYQNHRQNNANFINEKKKEIILLINDWANAEFHHRSLVYKILP